LLNSDGCCAVCGDPIGLGSTSADRGFEIHTTDRYQPDTHGENEFPADWPTVLCQACRPKSRRGAEQFVYTTPRRRGHRFSRRRRGLRRGNPWPGRRGDRCCSGAFS
jgi:hypothetical protein